MRSVVVLALLWQTAVVLGLGAIHAPDSSNNNRASSTLPWVGTEVWTTNLDTAFPKQVFTTAGELQVYYHSYNKTCDERLSTLDMNGGNQTSSASFGACLSYVAQQLPFVATLDNTVNVYAVNSSSVTPIMSFPPLSRDGAIFSVGDYFFWFATDDVSTTLTKINPRARTSTTSKGPGKKAGFVAGLNYLFAIGQVLDTYTVYSYSAATGDVIWTVSLPVGVKLVPAPSSDTVLFVFANYSSSLFNSATGEWIWTANVPAKKAMFAANTVILNMQVRSSANTTAVDGTSGKILWEIVGDTIDISPSYSCGLKSNILITVATIGGASFDPQYHLLGLDAQTGKKVLDYTPARGTGLHAVSQVLCQNDDVYLLTVNYDHGYTIVQRITFAPRP